MHLPINEIAEGTIVLNPRFRTANQAPNPFRNFSISGRKLHRRTHLSRFNRVRVANYPARIISVPLIGMNVMLDISDACLIVSQCLATGVVPAVVFEFAFCRGQIVVIAAQIRAVVPSAVFPRPMPIIMRKDWAGRRQQCSGHEPARHQAFPFVLHRSPFSRNSNSFIKNGLSESDTGGRGVFIICGDLVSDPVDPHFGKKPEIRLEPRQPPTKFLSRSC